MTPEGVDGRRLRFPLVLHEDESIPGAISRATREHVLGVTGPVLAAAGVEMRAAGYSQLASPAELTRLAYVLRCSPDELISRAGERLVGPKGTQCVEARFGRLIVPHMHLELDRRRIAPTSLATSGYHKLSWLNDLLPYAEDTYERLVDTCGSCGAVQGWRYVRGIGNCDVCGETILPSSEARLPEGLEEDYSFFARLFSLHSEAGEAASTQLPKSINEVSLGTLLRLALQVGGIVQDQPLVATSWRAIGGLAKPQLAQIASSGVNLLRSWPDGLRGWLEAKSLELTEQPRELGVIRRSLKRMVDKNRESAELVSVVSAALPELQKTVIHAFSGGRRYYLYSEVARKLGFGSHQKMQQLRTWPDLIFHSRTKSAKYYGHYDADQIDDLVPHFRDVCSFHTCSHRLKIPLYAVEQLCCAGVMEWEDHPAIRAAGIQNSVRLGSVEALVSALFSASCHAPRAGKCVPLFTALRRIGGRPKPWAAFVRALISGNLPFWVKDDNRNFGSLLVRPDDVTHFDHVSSILPETRLNQTEYVNQRDAAEILNIRSAFLAPWSQVLDLHFSPHDKGLAAKRRDVELVAEQIAWTGELALHLGVSGHKVSRVLSAAKIGRKATGWSRTHLIERGILPQIP